MKKIKLIPALLFAATLLTTENKAQAPVKNPDVRLSKVVFKGNDFTSETTYFYDTHFKINKIIYKQDGRLHYTINNITFNNLGLLETYTTTYNLKIAPQKTTISYNDDNQVIKIEKIKTIPTDKPVIISSQNYKWSPQQLMVTSAGNTTVYTFDADNNITEISFPTTSGADAFHFNKFDESTNPLTLTGGFVFDKPLSKRNATVQQLGSERYTYNVSYTYQKLLVSKHVPGAAKIPTQYRNGLPLKSTTTWYDPEAKRKLVTENYTYSYINVTH
ncbi:hypothetical protein ACFOWM_07245 [Ferruginibacter yonginensis]|uniref:DUF4595 domain-containing protein n=1 Tax=Ferruginibacter yonginensis TaxID=1310416 RepID=A0ABV8QQY8_9BACT